MFPGPSISKGDGNLGAKAPSDENILGLVCGGVLPGGGATYTTLGTSVKLIQASDADALGFTAAYDAANKVLIRYHINEFFLSNPNGVLWLMVVAQGTTLTNMCNVANNYVNKMVNDSLRAVKHIGTVLNPATGYTATLTGGVDNDVLTAIPMAQALVDAWALQNVYINSIIIEGREVNGTIASITDMRTKASPNVQVAILQDKTVAALDALYAKHAAVGTVLGATGVRRVQEDLGSINVIDNPDKSKDRFRLDNATTNRWTSFGISSGALMSSFTSTEIKTLKDRAYIFADSYPSFDGVFLVGSAACTLASSDFAYNVNTRVWNRFARRAVAKLIPKYNSSVETDDNGYISPITASEWQEDVNNSRDGLGSLVAEGSATKSDCYINPSQAVYTNSTVLVGMTIKPFGYAREIQGTLAFSIN